MGTPRPLWRWWLFCAFLGFSYEDGLGVAPLTAGLAKVRGRVDRERSGVPS